MFDIFCYPVFKERLLKELPSFKTKQETSSTLFLLRKEVIHPHVPVGIPCYDLTPVIGPTFDGSLPFGLGHRLRVLPTPMV